MDTLDQQPRAARTDTLARRGLKMSQLRLIAAVAETGQVAAAAQRVGLTQPAASRLLAQLEDVTGSQLYSRHPRGITLTEAGRSLARDAARVLNELDLAHERVTQASLGTSGQIRVGSVTGPSLQLLLPVVRDLRVAYPGIELGIEIDTSVKLAEALLSRDLDFFIGRIPDGADSRPFRFVPLQEEPISLIVRRGHPLTRRSDAGLEDCLNYDWVMQPPGGLLRQTAESYLLANGHDLPRRVLGTTSTLFTLALVHGTNAIAPLASAVADFYINDSGLGSRLDRLRVRSDIVVKAYGLVSRSEGGMSPAAERVLGLLRDRALARSRLRAEG
ncbi:LysR family transcriptional regulator [Psychromarinibacter sp. C21-152]|uniref:LysR family transcriptional regulator n=1 Tax=Psychromarinibacter sediminicola TaxID=3033385 RepID=A0AAE3T6S4_9RHOB|nr:LysR family transcriptional regulator [Psychromarinibacter sediminicola]MDF0599615.1 LysR family transcriptional regulator [Psychromarinibacter sediminicola]